MTLSKAAVAVPMGDPAGIGPEIVLKAVASSAVASQVRAVVLGERKVLEHTAKQCGLAVNMKEIHYPKEGDYAPGTINLINLKNVDMAAFQFGKISGMCGKAAYEYIEAAVRLANRHMVDAVSTPPINKTALREGGIHFIGHTEIFAALTKTDDPLTMFEVRGLRVFFLTRHVSLRQACESVTKERIIDYVKRCTKSLQQLGVTTGTMAIAGLNPHCGENGLFGEEEITQIIPAVLELQAQGYQVAGPIGADSVFHLALQGHFNSVLSLYHDQGHIATKTLDFEKTTAITTGMPILRTSVDHGTAFDIAGKGIADETSMVEAILLAAKYAPFFKRAAMG